MRSAKAFGLLATAALLVGLASPAAFGAQFATLSYTSDPGDFIGQGLSQNYSYATGNANINAQVLFTIGAAPKQATFLRFTMSSTTPGAPGAPPAFNVDVATNQLGTPFVAGAYANAERASFATAGHPGLDVSGAGRGCNTITGSFTVNSVTFSTNGLGDPVIETLDVNFEQHCEGAVPALRGRFTYAANVNLLTANKGGSGAGTVTSTPAGIDCGAFCSSGFNPGEVVSLTATPATGSVFAGWSGDCTGTGACSVTMDANRTVGATFNSLNNTLTITKNGTGLGTVTSSPTGIDCGGTCSAAFPSGTVVTLTPTPLTGSFFTGWSGACTGTGACSVTMDAARAVTATFTDGATIPRLVNISTRMQVLSGDDVLIAGFIIQGNEPKTVAIRARGPSLVPLGITNAIADPRLELYAAGPTLLLANDDWGTAANAATIQARGIAPSNAKESAILVTLVPGAYTAVVSGIAGATGVGIVEVFELDRPDLPLANISTRGQVGTGNNVMIAGIVIQGTGTKTVVVRARGPSLGAFGIANPLQDTVLQVFSGSTVIAQNDDWQASADAANIQGRGLAPSDARESAIILTLNPGAYTAILSGKNGATGVGIVEVFAQ